MAQRASAREIEAVLLSMLFDPYAVIVEFRKFYGVV
jgi:hypothetical protein